MCKWPREERLRDQLSTSVIIITTIIIIEPAENEETPVRDASLAFKTTCRGTLDGRRARALV